ncbi:hypothetical protein [Bradyrhizobium sp. STM 3809]|uniref:hypothetical protein n=1 Tax=Bradyrhizobium sp. STM 3809 TaxID=551936 RepID=UPI000240982A|nr:hypothetical protein [Bradyrhizobium sp. STM 3809]CCE01529.1 hypothetical protein BRAS3809_5150011 [Bradyrhizobium sp. STM 3809]
MHDPVDNSRDQTSSIGAGSPSEPERTVAVTIAPDIHPEPSFAVDPATGRRVGPEDHEGDDDDQCRKARLVTPTMWR